ncbi:MAG: type II toxin-antitoxin system Phd/YefM family antitoxin [Planctomycetes bacterium]|nr:type II toxin-antitoxin system Phd/YefM family antitoxin [Planctomycetota bacterium]
MKLAQRVKPISYLKSHASEVLRTVAQEKKTLLITHHGEVKLVIQGIEDYEALQESLALLKILALGEEKRRSGKFKSAKKAFDDLRKRIKGLEK